MAKGFIYIGQLEDKFTGHTLPYKKIGLTTTSISQREKELNGFPVKMPLTYRMIAGWSVDDVHFAETKLHRIFKSNQAISEFFFDADNYIALAVEEIMALIPGAKPFELEAKPIGNEPAVRMKWVLDIHDKDGNELFTGVEPHREKYLKALQQAVVDQDASKLLKLDALRIYELDSDRWNKIADDYNNSVVIVDGIGTDWGTGTGSKATIINNVSEMFDLGWIATSYQLPA